MLAQMGRRIHLLLGLIISIFVGGHALGSFRTCSMYRDPSICDIGPLAFLKLRIPLRECMADKQLIHNDLALEVIINRRCALRSPASADFWLPSIRCVYSNTNSAGQQQDFRWAHIVPGGAAQLQYIESPLIARSDTASSS